MMLETNSRTTTGNTQAVILGRVRPCSPKRRWAGDEINAIASPIAAGRQQCGKTVFSLDANAGGNGPCVPCPAVLQTAGGNPILAKGPLRPAAIYQRNPLVLRRVAGRV